MKKCLVLLIKKEVLEQTFSSGTNNAIYSWCSPIVFPATRDVDQPRASWIMGANLDSNCPLVVIGQHLRFRSFWNFPRKLLSSRSFFYSHALHLHSVPPKMAKLRLDFFDLEMLDHAILSWLVHYLSYHSLSERRKNTWMSQESTWVS